MRLPEDFNAYRSRVNEKIMASDSLIIKCIFNLDTNAYQQGGVGRASEYWESLQDVQA